MFFSDDDIDRIAKSLIAEFGDRAEEEARARSARARAQRLEVIAANWRRVLQAVAMLRPDDPDSETKPEIC